MRPALLLVPLLALTACGGADDDRTAPVAADARPSASAEPSPSPSRSSSPASPPAAGPTPAAPSAAPSPSAPARAVPAAQGDVDGDGEPDEVTYAGREAVVVLSGTGTTVRSSTDADIEADDPVTAGVEDLDRDGRAEVFVQVGQGASTGFLLVLRYDGRALAALTAGGRPLLLGFGGSATHGDGFSCTDDGALVVRSATSEDGEAYALQTVTYRVSGGELVESGRTDGTGSGPDDPAVAAAYVVDCRSVGEGG